MRADIVGGAAFPDYELTDHTGKRRKLSDLQGPDHPEPDRTGLRDRAVAQTSVVLQAEQFAESSHQ